MNFNKSAIFFLLTAVVISGLSNFINKFGLTIVGKNAFQYTTLKNLAAALILSLVLVSTPRVISELKVLTKKDWLKLGLIGLVGGGVPFLLYFQGLSMTSAVSASFIHKTLFIWAGILAWPILHERFTRWQLAALAVLFFGNWIFDGLGQIHFGYPELLVFSAVLMWAIENVLAKIFLQNMASGIVAWGRMFFGSIILLIFLVSSGNLAGLLESSSWQWSWIALVGLLLAGYNFFWYGALKSLPVTVVASVLALASPLTALLNAIFVTHTWSWSNNIGIIIVLIAVGVIFSSVRNKRYEYRLSQAV